MWNDARMIAKVVAWRDSRADTPRAADIGVMVLRTLLKYGRPRGRVVLTVAVDRTTLYRNGQRAGIIWTDDDIARFEAKAAEVERPHLVDGLRLAALTGLRREDLVTLTCRECTLAAQTLFRSNNLKVARRRAALLLCQEVAREYVKGGSPVAPEFVSSTSTCPIYNAAALRAG